MLRLLQVTAGRGIEVGYINQLIPAFGIGTPPAAIARPASAATPQPAPGTALIEPLSERELQVLRLLDSPLTSEEIGRELYVSANTVRTHIRNIYGKLDVHGRLEAIQKARDLKLI
jgi:LuxR family maltose regulon positive regulatory protein